MMQTHTHTTLNTQMPDNHRKRQVFSDDNKQDSERLLVGTVNDSLKSGTVNSHHKQ